MPPPPPLPLLAHAAAGGSSSSCGPVTAHSRLSLSLPLTAASTRLRPSAPSLTHSPRVQAQRGGRNRKRSSPAPTRPGPAVRSPPPPPPPRPRRCFRPKLDAAASPGPAGAAAEVIETNCSALVARPLTSRAFNSTEQGMYPVDIAFTQMKAFSRKVFPVTIILYNVSVQVVQNLVTIHWELNNGQ